MDINYFELFGIPVQLKVDKAGLHSKYIALSRQYHPDYFVQQGEDKQAEALDISATLNKAYKTFQDPDATIRYVLQSKGLLEEEEKYQLPPEFLMEMMELNEEIMEGPAPDGDLDVQIKIDQLESLIYEPVKKIVEGYQDGVTTEEELLQVKEYYYKKKYLQRINSQLDQKM